MAASSGDGRWTWAAAAGVAVVALAVTNPGTDDFEAFAGDQLVRAASRELCGSGSLPLIARLVIQDCPQLVASQRKVLGQLAAASSRRYNAGLFSIYTTELGGQTLLPGLTIPRYRAVTLGGGAALGGSEFGGSGAGFGAALIAFGMDRGLEQRLQCLVPRALLDPERTDLPCGDAQGLLPVELRWQGEQLSAIEPCGGSGLPLALTPLVDPHVHLDKAFSWPDFPNYSGRMQAALALNLEEGQSRTAEQVLQRGELALDRAWRYGLRGLRSHIDSGGPCAEPSWQALLELQQRWTGRIELQLVALAPLSHWRSSEGLALARRVAAAGGLLGGVLGPPFPSSGRDGADLDALLQLAGELGCGIDLHIDESSEAPAAGVQLLVQRLERFHPGVPITCSHASSMGLLKAAQARPLAQRLQRLGVAVVALPTTNFWLLGREQSVSSGFRPLAPLRLLQQEGVAVALGADNVQDPWYPGGDFDPLDLLRLSFRATHTPPWERQGLMPFTTTPARLLGLAWDGVLRVGGPADLLLTSAGSWAEFLAHSPQRRVLRQGRWLPPPDQAHPDVRLANVV